MQYKESMHNLPCKDGRDVPVIKHHKRLKHETKEVKAAALCLFVRWTTSCTSRGIHDVEYISKFGIKKAAS